MFLNYFYHLRNKGLDVSTKEWMTLLSGMEKGLHQNSLTGFYYLCRSIVSKTESDYDKYDKAFLEFFKDVHYEGEELPPELWNFLNNPTQDLMRDMEELSKAGFSDENFEELMKRLEDLIKEQQGLEHNGGKKWIGTQGYSPFGNNGWHPNGIRIGGESHNRTAMAVAGERRFRDFRKDNTLDTRQFQMAFKGLRQLTTQVDTSEKVLDIDGTIRETCDNAGMLKIKEKNPRKNSIKLLMLMDSGGSMRYYSNLCSMLFQAAEKSNHFKELHIYYFHNCIRSCVYSSPTLESTSAVDTDWLLSNFDENYKVIIVGDAAMNPYELMEQVYVWARRAYDRPGIEWLDKLQSHFSHIIWLNPDGIPTIKNFWTQTSIFLSQRFDMYPLSTEGLEHGMKKLMVRN